MRTQKSLLVSAIIALLTGITLLSYTNNKSIAQGNATQAATADANQPMPTPTSDVSFLFKLDDNGMPMMTPIKTSKSYTIGVSQIGNSFPFVVAMVEGSNQAEKDMGFKQILTDAQGDVQKQIAQLEDITAFKDSVSLIGVDEVGTGVNIGNIVVKLLPNGGKVAIIEGAAGFGGSNERSDGFKEVLSKNPNIKIVASQPGNWDRKTALSIAENFIQAYPDLDVIYAHNDDMAMDAVSALRDAHLLDKVKVIGIGGSIEGLEAIKKGELYASVFDSPKAAAYVCSKALVAHLEGMKIPAEIWLPRPIITKDNVDKFKGEW